MTDTMASSTVAAATATAAANSAPSTAANTADPAATRGVPYYEKLRKELRETLQKKRLLDKNLAALEESIYRFEQSYLEETGAGNIIKGFDHYIKGAVGPSLISSTSGIASSFSGSIGGNGGISGGIGGASGSGGAAAAGGGGNGGGGGPTTRRKTQVLDLDRVFSRSSASFMRDSPGPPSSAHTTPSHAATPTFSGPGSHHNSSNAKDTSAPSSVKGGNGGGASKNKKKSANAARDREDDDEGGDVKPPIKRLKITYGRGD